MTTRESVRHDATSPRSWMPRTANTVTVARIPMITMATKISTSVKPRSQRW